MSGSNFRGTKGRILPLLRGPGKTVGELADTLGLTGNAVRAHLAALERDGLLETREVRRGPAKPSLLYSLTPAGESLFPKAHGLLLGAMLETLRSRLDPAERERFLDEVARRLPAEGAPPGSPLPVRLAAAAAAFRGLGGVPEIEKTSTGYALFCRDCPLGDVSSHHDEPCGIAGAVLGGVLGEPLETRCQRGTRSRCRFELVLPAESTDPEA